MLRSRVSSWADYSCRSSLPSFWCPLLTICTIAIAIRTPGRSGTPMGNRCMRSAVVLILGALSAFGQDLLTLAQARQMALKNHPQIQTAQALAEASEAVPVEIRSRYYPTLGGSLTAVGAPGTNSALLAGALTNSTVLSRVGAGVTVTQLITDFGRTHHLAESATLRAKAQDQVTNATTAQILLQVTRAFYESLRTQAVLRVARDTV